MSQNWSQGWRPYLLLIVLCLGLYAPGLATMPVTDRDEARFAQASRQMMETGDWIRIRFRDEARNKKPVGIYWLQSMAVEAFSDPASNTIWPYRLPSLLGATIAALLTFALGRHLVGAPAALLGAALLASSLTLTVEAHLAKTDAALLACVTAAQFALGEIYRRARAGMESGWRWALLFWIATGIGILIKGPVGPLIAILTIAALAVADREARWLKQLRPLWGFLLVILMVAPWLIAILKATNGAFAEESLGRDFFSKVVGVQEGHGAPPGSYLIALALTFWPGSLFLIAGVRRALRERDRPSQRFLLAWLVPFWALLELVPTKLPHYLLPVFPALALLAAHALFNAAPRPLLAKLPAAILWAIAALALAAAMVLGPLKMGAGLLVIGLVGAAIVLIGGGALLWRNWREAGPGQAAAAAVLALAIFAPGFAFVTPALDSIWLSRSAANLIRDYAPPAGTPLIVTGYNEPSLTFMLGTKTRIVNADEAARAMTSARGVTALIENREDAAFRAALTAMGWTPREVGSIEGLDYSNGKKMVLRLYTASPG